MSARTPPRRQSASPSSDQGERLQKVLAAAGIGSRRQCEQLILEGRVEVDAKVVTQLGTRIDPHKQKVRVDGVALAPRRSIYYIINKPPGIVCTNRDPQGRLRVIDLIETDERLFTVGRLDKSSEGLLLVTNDGDLANGLTHPRYGVEKTYYVEVIGQPSGEELESLRRGVHLAEGVARVTSVKIRRKMKKTTALEMVLNEGRNREIRRLLARFGNKVVCLRRIAVGPLKLGNLPVGAHRSLAREEINSLRHAIASPTAARRPSTKKRGRAGDRVPSRGDAVRGRPRKGPPQGKKKRPPRKPGR